MEFWQDTCSTTAKQAHAQPPRGDQDSLLANLDHLFFFLTLLWAEEKFLAGPAWSELTNAGEEIAGGSMHSSP